LFNVVIMLFIPADNGEGKQETHLIVFFLAPYTKKGEWPLGRGDRKKERHAKGFNAIKSGEAASHTLSALLDIKRAPI
jgi:hypothetical protein